MVGAKAVKDLNHLFCQKIIEMQWHLKWQYVLLVHRASPANLFLLVHTKDEFLSHAEKCDGFYNKLVLTSIMLSPVLICFNLNITF